MEKLVERKSYIYLFFILLGIALRFWVMSFGYNFDFESYKIVGELVTDLKNVYASTSRYNYGPIFMCIQGVCYKLSLIYGTNADVIYRVLIVAVLTLGDLGIAYYIKRKFNVMAAIIFFLNPISIIITGYHNQFDNLAIIVLLAASVFYNEDEEFSRKDIYFLLLFTGSLMIKHIAFMLPLWLLLRKGLPMKKKFVYAFIPPLVFLLSFVPFIIGNTEALQGVLDNVFLYRSFNNAPLLHDMYELIGIAEENYFYCYFIVMAIAGVIYRKRCFQELTMLYLICMVAFSSAVANQYLVIPLVALVILSSKSYWLYSLVGLLYLFNDGNGLHMNWEITSTQIGNFIMTNAYALMCVCLVIGLLENSICRLNLIHENENSTIGG